MHVTNIINMRYQAQNEAMDSASKSKSDSPNVSTLSHEKLKDFDVEYE